MHSQDTSLCLSRLHRPSVLCLETTCLQCDTRYGWGGYKVSSKCRLTCCRMKSLRVLMNLPLNLGLPSTRFCSFSLSPIICNSSPGRGAAAAATTTSARTLSTPDQLVSMCLTKHRHCQWLGCTTSVVFPPACATAALSEQASQCCEAG